MGLVDVPVQIVEQTPSRRQVELDGRAEAVWAEMLSTLHQSYVRVLVTPHGRRVDAIAAGLVIASKTSKTPSEPLAETIDACLRQMSGQPVRRAFRNAKRDRAAVCKRDRQFQERWREKQAVQHT